MYREMVRAFNDNQQMKKKYERTNEHDNEGNICKTKRALLIYNAKITY